MKQRVQRAQANTAFKTPDCFFVLASISVGPASQSPCTSIIWIARDRAISEIDRVFVIIEKESISPIRDGQRSLVILVDTQCKARKPDCFVAAELRIDSKAQRNIGE